MVEVPAEVWAKTLRFLNRVGDGYYELSSLKVQGEYRYFKSKAREILGELREERPALPAAPFNDDF